MLYSCVYVAIPNKQMSQRYRGTEQRLRSYLSLILHCSTSIDDQPFSTGHSRAFGQETRQRRRQLAPHCCFPVLGYYYCFPVLGYYYCFPILGYYHCFPVLGYYYCFPVLGYYHCFPVLGYYHCYIFFHSKIQLILFYTFTVCGDYTGKRQRRCDRRLAKATLRFETKSVTLRRLAYFYSFSFSLFLSRSRDSALLESKGVKMSQKRRTLSENTLNPTRRRRRKRRRKRRPAARGNDSLVIRHDLNLQYFSFILFIPTAISTHTLNRSHPYRRS